MTIKKEKLTLIEQIHYMKNEKGVLFNLIDEKDALSYISEKNYFFKTKAFMKNYDKYKTGVK